MEITVDQLLQGKQTSIKNKNYFQTSAYVEPFLERMSKLTDDFRVQVKLPDQITIEDDKEDITYNRVNIEAILPDEYAFEGHKRVVGFVYALDTRKAVVKQYVGSIRSACLNLCVFNPDALQVSEIEPETPINYSFLNNCLSLVDSANSILTKLSNTTYSKAQCQENLGNWVDNTIKYSFTRGFGKVKLSESTPIEAYKNLFYNEKSSYYSKESEVTGFDIYNSFTDLVCNGTRVDIINRFEKVFLVAKILNLV